MGGCLIAAGGVVTDFGDGLFERLRAEREEIGRDDVVGNVRGRVLGESVGHDLTEQDFARVEVVSKLVHRGGVNVFHR